MKANSLFAIRVEGLGKRYRLGEREPFYHRTLRDTLAKALRRKGKHAEGAVNRGNERFSQYAPNGWIWAIKDVDFEVRRGEVFGVIGRNGSGKSTLLKVLSRITKPTEGRATIHGRVGALLEVGTGFHPELTGRENIYLSGVILGMKKTEIARRFDEIVSFAEIERFVDTPVKRYSSGMHVRLAFAVAAHLEPEILLVDEVLAVGDAGFQRKCLGKMGDVAGGGRTVLFVSHNMGAVSQLCGRCLWLEDGQIVKTGCSHEVIHDYLATVFSCEGMWSNPSLPTDEGGIHLVSASIVAEKEGPERLVRFDEPFSLLVEYEILRQLKPSWTLVFRVSDATGNAVFTSWDIDGKNHEKPTEMGHYRAFCRIPRRLLRPGAYAVSLGVYFTDTNMQMSDFKENIFCFEVSSVGYGMNANRGGIITPVLEWEIEARRSKS